MTTGLRICTITALFAMLFLPTLNTFAQDDPSKRCQDSGGKQQFCNGISVGAPKVFDNRTLTLMLESLSQTLQQQQTNYIDQKSVAAALANIQGFSQTDTTTNTSITATPTPATDVKTTLNTGNVSSTGTPLPNTFQRQTDVNRASITPTTPTLDTTPAFQGFTPTYGSSAPDLLSDQVNLTYQIFNLRMILERALSDRLLATGKPRRPAVFGFNVTVDPPRTANDAVAVVEITLESKDGKDMSLVSLMPQEKTYNAAALSTKSNSFGGSAVVSSFQVGFSARRRGQIFYLYRDNDTIAYERMTGDTKKLVFGWMFRPVLGRRSVSPGLRQLFAIAALPDDDCPGPNCSSPCAGKADACRPSSGTPLVTSVRTYWKKYDRGTLTSFERHHANRAKEFWYGLSLSLAKPQIFDGREYENVASYPNVEVKPSTEYENDLKPRVNSVTWRSTGAKNIIVSAQGENFFSQTKVALGDQTYADGSGLILKSNQAFDLVTTIDALVSGPGTIIGRYGNGVQLVQKDSFPPGFGSNGVMISEQGVRIGPSIGGSHRIEIPLVAIPDDNIVQAEQAARTGVKQAQQEVEQREQQKKSLEDAQSAQQAATTHSAQMLAQNKVNAFVAQFGDLNTLQQSLSTARAELDAANAEFQTRHRALVAARSQHGLQDLTENGPVISVNGKILDRPYYRIPIPGGGAWLQANVADADLAVGGAFIKVSWPFFAADKWTVYDSLSNPDLAFEIGRLSDKSIVIHRKDGLSFVNGPEMVAGASACWKLITGDTEFPLGTSKCSPPPPPAAPKDCPKKTGPCDSPPPPPIGLISDFTVSATASAALPDTVVLVAPSGSVYNLTVPPLKAKDDKAAPIELNQFDSEWIQVKSTELTPGPGSTSTTTAKAPADFSALNSVQANGKPVNYRLQTIDPKAIDPKTGKPKPPLLVEIEITRALTSNPGVVQVGFFSATDLLGTRQIHITQTQWDTEGDK